MGQRKPTGSSNSSRITIYDIKDQEDKSIPPSALKSIVKRVSETMQHLGVKARIETREQ